MFVFPISVYCVTRTLLHSCYSIKVLTNLFFYYKLWWKFSIAGEQVRMLNKTSSDQGISWKTSEAKKRNTFYLVTNKLPCVSLLFSYLAPLNHSLEGLQNNSVKYLYKCLPSYIRHKDFLRPPPSCSSVTLRGPPLDSETGWTGKLWSKTNLLIWKN